MAMVSYPVPRDAAEEIRRIPFYHPRAKELRG